MFDRHVQVLQCPPQKKLNLAIAHHQFLGSGGGHGPLGTFHGLKEGAGHRLWPRVGGHNTHRPQDPFGAIHPNDAVTGFVFLHLAVIAKGAEHTAGNGAAIALPHHGQFRQTIEAGAGDWAQGIHSALTSSTGQLKQENCAPILTEGNEFRPQWASCGHRP